MVRFLVLMMAILSAASVTEASANAKDPPRIVCEATLSCAPESVWTLWTTADGLQRFLARSARVGSEVGGEYSIDLGAGYLADLAHVPPPQIRAIREPALLAFDWIIPLPAAGQRDPKTVVTVRVDPATSGRCRLRLQHGGWNAGDERSPEFTYSKRYWKDVLQAMRRALARP